MSVFDTDFTDIKTHLNYEAWEWLPYDKWTVDNLLMEQRVNGCRQCKVMDCWVPPNQEEAHVAAHIEFDKARRMANKELNATLTGTPLRKRREPVELILPEGEFTIAQAKELNNALNIATVRQHILSRVETGELIAAGQAESAGRGRRANLYKTKEAK